jgi:hypothetical protein
MSQQHSPFVVSSLRPETMTGQVGGVYQLTNASVSPTRIIGRDEIGMPIEDTVPAAYWKYFVHPCGAINKVVLRTAAVFDMSPEAERYEIQVTREIVGQGWIPLAMCPYSFELSHVTGGAFVKVPDGEKDCGGKPDGCDHMKSVIASRVARAKKKHDDDERALHAIKHEEAERMIAAVSEGVGIAMARHADPKAARKAMSSHLAGKGED